VPRVDVVAIAWTTAFIDRPADVFDSAVTFWLAATASSLSATRGAHGQFATVVPPDGDAYLRVQRVDADRGSHLDLHVDDVEGFVAHALASGAEVERSITSPPILRSPAGMASCAVAYHGAGRRPAPTRSASGVLNLIDQLCIDIPAARFDQECEFWSALTGWELRASSVRQEFRFLVRPPDMPLRILLQRRNDDEGPAHAHLDIASDDVDALVADHEALGASVTERFDYWTVMTDPSGHPYCVTSRDPRTGLLA
jgi:predicted enzyme related to lactoylglutathione lyase